RSPSRALNQIRSPWIVRSAPNAATRTAGIELVTCRGRALAGATPGTGRTQTSCGRSWLSPIATSVVPSAVNPTDRHTPGHGLTIWPAPVLTTDGGFFGGRPRGRFSGPLPPIGATI